MIICTFLSSYTQLIDAVTATLVWLSNDEFYTKVLLCTFRAELMQLFWTVDTSHGTGILCQESSGIAITLMNLLHCSMHFRRKLLLQMVNQHPRKIPMDHQQNGQRSVEIQKLKRKIRRSGLTRLTTKSNSTKLVCGLCIGVVHFSIACIGMWVMHWGNNWMMQYMYSTSGKIWPYMVAYKRMMQLFIT